VSESNDLNLTKKSIDSRNSCWKCSGDDIASGCRFPQRKRKSPLTNDFLFSDSSGTLRKRQTSASSNTTISARADPIYPDFSPSIRDRGHTMDVYLIQLVVDSMKRYRWSQVLDFLANIMNIWWVTLTSFDSGAQIFELYRGTTLTSRGMYLHLRSTSAHMKWGQTPWVTHPSSDRLPTVLLHTHCFFKWGCFTSQLYQQHWVLSGLQLGKG